MPTGSLPLLEATKCGNDTLKRGVIEVILQESPILEMLPWLTISGNAYKHTVESTLPVPQFRDVNETYSRVWASDTEHFWGVAILGNEVFVDNFLINVTGNVQSPKARQYAKVAKAHALFFDKTFFDGTGTAKDFKGINTLISEGFGTKYTPNANGGALTLDDLDIAHDYLRAGDADAILTNRTLRRKITKLARTSVSGVSLIDTGTDQFGRQVTQWNGIPIRILGNDHTDTAILGFDETEGSSNVTSSLYLVKFGEDEFVTGLLGANGHMDVRDFGETEAAPGHLGRVEWYPGIGIFSPFSIVRYSGITNA